MFPLTNIFFPFKHHQSEFQHSTSMSTPPDIAFDDELSNFTILEQEPVISAEPTELVVLASDSIEIILDVRRSTRTHHSN